jgi:hypothetical protein
MKLLRFAPLLLVISNAAVAQEPPSEVEGPRVQLTALPPASVIAGEALFDLLLDLDAQQTKEIVGYCRGRVGCNLHETNPVLRAVELGEPSASSINNYFLTAAALHVIVTMVLPEAWRSPWQWGSVAVEGVTVGRNKALGLKVKF